jgi:hypothetical protein
MPLSDQQRRFVLVFTTISALALVVLGVMLADTGPSSVGDTAGGAVEDQIPRPGDQILRQDQVGVDLAEGWTGTLTVEGITIPEEQVTRNLGPNQILFQPGPGKVLEELGGGSRCVVATVWEIARGPGQARPVSWCFEVL